MSKLTWIGALSAIAAAVGTEAVPIPGASDWSVELLKSAASSGLIGVALVYVAKMMRKDWERERTMSAAREESLRADQEKHKQEAGEREKRLRDEAAAREKALRDEAINREKSVVARLNAIEDDFRTTTAGQMARSTKAMEEFVEVARQCHERAKIHD